MNQSDSSGHIIYCELQAPQQSLFIFPDMKTEREQAFYKEMFIQLLDIVDAITGQMFERISVIPYTIR